MRESSDKPLALFAVLLAGVWGVLEISWFVVSALLHPYLPGGWWTVAGLGLLIAVPPLVVVRSFAGGSAPSAFKRLWIIRPFWYTVLIGPVLALAGALGFLGGLLVSTPHTGGRLALAVVGVSLATVALLGYYGTRQLRVRSFEARLAGLPHSFKGMRIVQLSDLHVGPHTSRKFLRRIADAVRNAKPDLLVFTGDQVDDYPEDLIPFRDAFGDLTAPHGVIAIAGNHDVYAGWTNVRRGMEEMGMKVLVNEAIPLKRGDEQLWIAATGDPAGSQWPRGGGGAAAPDVARTLAEIPPGAVTLALAHNPVLWPALAARGVQLTLSGHTHHGQFSIPSLGWSIASVFLEHAMGIHRRGQSLLYINPGTNYWGIPLRVGSLPEVTVVTLARATAESEMVEQ